MSRKLEKIAFLTLLSTEKGSKGFSQNASRAHISDPKIHHLSLAKIDENLELPDKVRSSNFQIFIFKISILQGGALGTHWDAKHLSWNSCH